LNNSLPIETTTNQRPSIERIDRQQRNISILWKDGHRSVFHHIWLRDNCTCLQCGDRSGGHRYLELGSIDPDITPDEVSIDSSGSLQIRWDGDGHRSNYAPAWLLEHCYSADSIAKQRQQPILWDSTFNGKIPEWDYDRVITDELIRLQMFQCINDYGFAIINGVPVLEDQIEGLAEIFGFIRETHYGRIFDLISTPQQRILAQTAHAIRPHNDELFRDPIFAAYDSFLYTYYFGFPPEDWPPGIDTYSAADGTSFSAPLVAGYLGLLRSQCSGISLSQARQVLHDSAADIGPNGYDAETGHGRLNMVIPDNCPTSSGNTQPTAVINGDLTVVDTAKPGSERVVLDGSGSFDAEDGNLLAEYLWSWAGQSSGSASGATLSVQLAVGDYDVSLTVTDSGGEINTASAAVYVLPKGGGGGGEDPGDSSGGNEKGAKKCNDGIDNDGDGAIDSGDLGCR
jgi:DUF971 family protein